MAETVAFSSLADEKLAMELVAKRTQALQARIAELEQVLGRIREWAETRRTALEDGHDPVLRAAFAGIEEAARKALGEGE